METTLTAYEIAEWIAFLQIEAEEAERRRLEHIAQVESLHQLNAQKSSEG